METTTCAGCGRVQAATHRYCDMCNHDLSVTTPVSTSSVGSSSQPVSVSVNEQFQGVEAAAQEALNRARFFTAINKIVFALGLSGSILLIIWAFIPTCPPLLTDCYDKKLYNFVTLFPIGIGSLLSVLWLNGIAETIASRAALAAEVAKAQSK